MTGRPDRSVRKIQIINYDGTSFKEDEVNTAAKCLSYIKNKKKTTWVNVNGLKNGKLFEELAKGFNLHPLVLEDILHTQQRPKMEDYDDYLYIVVRMLTYDEKHGRIGAEQVSVILGRNFVISIQEKEGDLFDKVQIGLDDFRRCHGFVLPDAGHTHGKAHAGRGARDLLEGLVGIRAYLLDGFHHLFEPRGDLAPLVDRHLVQLDAIAFQHEPVERLLHVRHAGVRQLAALDEVALIVVAVLAAQEHDAVEPAG